MASTLNWTPSMVGGPMQPGVKTPANPSTGGVDWDSIFGQGGSVGPMAGSGNPYDTFMQWLSGGGDTQSAAGTLSGGFGDAANTIKDATAQAKAQLQPYAQGGLQDYTKYRDMVNSGYFNQPFSGTYQAPTMQTQAFNPTYDKASGTYKNNYTPWQAPQQAQISQPRLPQYTPSPGANAPAMPSQSNPGQPPASGMNPQLMAMLSQLLQQGHNNNVPSAGVPTSPVANYSPTQTGATPMPNSAQAQTSNPYQDWVRQMTGRNTTSPTMTMQDLMAKIGIGRTGPYGLQGIGGAPHGIV